MRKAYTVTDLGPGDGGKGSVIHALCALRRPHTVIKVGGAQGSHGVRTSRGERFVFSHFGCGTFEGAMTHLSEHFVLDPNFLMNEGDALRRDWGIMDSFKRMTVDGDALCTTRYHRAASRLRELARKGSPRGTVGVGVGEAFQDSKTRPELSIKAKDLVSRDLSDRLEAVRIWKLDELREIIDGGFLVEDSHEVAEQMAILRGGRWESLEISKIFLEMAMRVRIVDAGFYEENILARAGTIVFESSHGVLTDRYHGFHPHASRLRTLPNITTWDPLRKHGYDGEIVRLGITRAYQIRHGAGPMVTESPSLRERLLEGSVGEPDRYRGDIRVGPLDLVSLRYAIEACGGPSAFDALVVTWFDQVLHDRVWQVCNRYTGADDSEYFSPEGEILVRRGTDEAQLAYQARLVRKLMSCQPEVKSYAIGSGATRKEMADLCAGVLNEGLGVPVKMMSFGPTEKDKEYF